MIAKDYPELEDKLKYLQDKDCYVKVILKDDYPHEVEGTAYFEIIGTIIRFGNNSKGTFPYVQLKRSETYTKYTSNGKEIFKEIIPYERIKDVVKRTIHNDPQY